MTQELLSQAVELDNKINQCEKALQFMTHGTFHRHGEGVQTYLPLPEEVCQKMRIVIEAQKNIYEKELEEL